MGGDTGGGNFADDGTFKNTSNMTGHVSEEESHFEGLDSDSIYGEKQSALTSHDT